MNAIQAALLRGETDEWIIERIVEETRVDEGVAWQILAREKGENVDCCQEVSEDTSDTA